MVRADSALPMPARLPLPSCPPTSPSAQSPTSQPRPPAQPPSSLPLPAVGRCIWTMVGGRTVGGTRWHSTRWRSLGGCEWGGGSCSLAMPFWVRGSCSHAAGGSCGQA